MNPIKIIIDGETISEKNFEGYCVECFISRSEDAAVAFLERIVKARGGMSISGVGVRAWQPNPLDSDLQLKVSDEDMARLQTGEVFSFAFTSFANQAVLFLVPTSWSDTDRAEAVLQVASPEEYFGLLSPLAWITILRTQGRFEVAAQLLTAGWSPHEAFSV